MTLHDVPFDPEGNMLHDTSWQRDIQRRTVEPFEATLVYHEYGRGSSSITFYWIGAGGVRYPMFLSDLNRLLKEARVTDGQATGWWRAVRRSGYHGIQQIPVGELPCA